MSLTDQSDVSAVTILQPVGSQKTVGSETPSVLEVDASGNILRATGTTVPTNATAGYAKSALFIKTDASTGVGGLYENIGTTSSCNFNLIGSITAGEITLARGNLLVGNSSGVAAALDANDSGKILVGDGTDLASVAVSGDATLAANGAITIAAGVVTRAKMSAAAGSKVNMATSATIATTGNTDVYLIIPETGTLTSVDFSGVDVLAANDSNYITFSITNLGQAGAGSTVMLAATDANTTKATGGTALAANTKRALTLTGTGADLSVTQGDRLRIRAAATGTLANTVTFPVYCARFSGTT